MKREYRPQRTGSLRVNHHTYRLHLPGQVAWTEGRWYWFFKIVHLRHDAVADALGKRATVTYNSANGHHVLHTRAGVGACSY